MTEIDPMVQQLIDTINDEWRVVGPAWPPIRAKRGVLAAQITERLKRPSREDLTRRLDTYGRTWTQWWSTGLKSVSLTEIEQEILDLVCGPEPKPKGVPIHKRLSGMCDQGIHDSCAATWEEPTRRVCCTCECHKEASHE